MGSKLSVHLYFQTLFLPYHGSFIINELLMYNTCVTLMIASDEHPHTACTHVNYVKSVTKIPREMPSLIPIFI